MKPLSSAAAAAAIAVLEECHGTASAERRASALAAARAAASALAAGRQPGTSSAAAACAACAGAAAGGGSAASGNFAAAAQAAAAALAANRGAGSGARPAATPEDEARFAEAKRAEAAAAFAQSLQQGKRPRWGGPNELATRDAEQDEKDEAAKAKARQAIAVSELSSKLAAFRKDRGVETEGLAVTHSVRIDIPEVAEANRFNPQGGFERNWVAILIGKEGINKRRFEAETGATLYLRGKGTRLRHDGPKEIKKAGRGQYRVEDKEDAEPMHVLLEADTEEKLDLARVKLLGILEPKGESTSLALYDDTQLTKLAMAKTVSKEECAFCGKEGHHHSVCPNRRTTFQMAGVRCSVCGSAGHSARDCKGDRSGAVKLVPTSAAPSTLADADYAAFLSELDSRTTR